MVRVDCAEPSRGKSVCFPVAIVKGIARFLAAHSHPKRGAYPVAFREGDDNSVSCHRH
jgi:hypothetical protein